MFNMKWFDFFTDNKYCIQIKWFTNKVQLLFKLKSRNPHQSCVIYEDVCSLQEYCIGETVRNVKIKQQDTKKDSETQIHLKIIQTDSFTWKVFLSFSSNRHTRRNMEASIIVLKQLSLKELVISDWFHLIVWPFFVIM